MKIAVDAMGGDFAPKNIVTGALDAARKLQGIERLILVGCEQEVRRELDEAGDIPAHVEIKHAAEVVDMGEAPANAIRRKKDSSISRSVDMVKNGEADAVFSAGNTGAVVAAATLKLRTLEGVDRPAIATVIPTLRTPMILIDAGANTDCTPAMLAQFAVMGAVYHRTILGSDHPVVGLLSIGGEASKGNAVTKETFRILKESSLNFAGNIEGHDLFEGNVQVVVCDGFVGNVVLKTSEAAAHVLFRWMKDEFTRNPIRKLGAMLLKPALRSIVKRSDPSTYGGAPLLGARGICIIGHGSSSAIAVYNGIRVAMESVQHQINDLIIKQVASLLIQA